MGVDQFRFIRYAPRLVSLFALAIGTFNLISNTVQRFEGTTRTLNNHFLVFLNSTAFATSILTSLILIILSRALKRKKKRAWQLAVAMLALTLFADFFRYKLHLTQNLLVISLFILMIAARSQFQAKSDPTARLRPIYALLVGFIFFFLVGIVIFYFRHSESLVNSPSVLDVMLTVLSGFVWVEGPIKLGSNLAEQTLHLTLGIFGLFIIFLPLFTFLRKVSKVAPAGPEDQSKIIELTEKYGDLDSLAYFATRDDKSVIWSKNRNAGIAYRVENGVMLASGDPFGDYSLWPEVIQAFLDRAAEFGWIPAVMGSGERGGRAWVEFAGLSAIEIGDEAVIDASDFTLEGHQMSNVRQTINKARREGFTSRIIRVSDLSPEERRLLVSLAKRWRGDSIERGFSMSMDRFLGALDQDCTVAIGYRESEIVGFLYLVPWGKVGLSLDRMQRAPIPVPGLTELLIVDTISFLRSSNLRFLSLNFAAFRSVIERAEKISAGPILRTFRYLIKLASGWFQVESLYRFNSKFKPDWNPRYLLYPGVTDLGNVILAALRAEKFIAGFGRRTKV